MLVAEITGEARRHAKWRPLTPEEEAAAVTELRALAAGRSDLLAEVAGIFEGTSEGEPDEPFARCAARLCCKAGADEALIPQWAMRGGAGQLPPAGRRVGDGDVEALALMLGLAEEIDTAIARAVKVVRGDPG